MDYAKQSAHVFHDLADRYYEQFMGVEIYNDSYLKFCDLLRPGPARVLDAACGPGNVSRYLLSQRPDLDLLGIDLAPRMVELARSTVPTAQFLVHDCRQLLALQRRFDGIICAFGLPYLTYQEVKAFIESAAKALEPGGVLYLSTMSGNPLDSGIQISSTGDPIYVNYHNAEQINHLLELHGFKCMLQQNMASPDNALKVTTDLIVIARK